MIELCPLMSRLKSGIWPILGLKLAILATFFKISTSKIEGKTKLEVNPTQNYQFSLQKSHINGHMSILVFSKVSITKRLITSATINIFHNSFFSC